MTVVEKTSGGVVYVRLLDRRFTIGDRVDVSAEQAARLVGRGDFERVNDAAADGESSEGENDGSLDTEPDGSEAGDGDDAVEADGADDTDEAADADQDDEEPAEPTELLSADTSDESVEDDTETEPDAVAFDPSDNTNAEVAELVEDVDTVEELDAIRELETADKNRTGALDAIDDRLDELEG